jgi:hypothetical protein
MDDPLLGLTVVVAAGVASTVILYGLTAPAAARALGVSEEA